MCTPSWMTTLAEYARRGLSALYVRNRVLTKAMKALDGQTPYEVLYDVKLELADLCAFGALCAIVGRIGNGRTMG